MSAIRNTVSHDAENLKLVPILEPYSDNHLTKEQELANCHVCHSNIQEEYDVFHNQ